MMSKHAPDCLDAVILANFAVGALSSAQHAAAQEHILRCADCYASFTTVLRVLEREEDARLTDRVSAGGHSGYARRGWWPAAAAILLLLIGVGAWYRLRISRTPDLAPLVEASGALSERPIEARLVGFPWAQYDPPREGRARQPKNAARLQMDGKAGELLEKTNGRRDPQSRHVNAIASLLSGDSAGAVEKLESLTKDQPGQAVYWSDLAAAYLTFAIDERAPDRLGLALAAADRALRLNPQLPAARFNRAVILEELRLHKQAVAAYSEYLAVDSTSPWAAEAQRRRADLSIPTRSDGWRKVMPRLEKADESTVASITRDYPQDVRAWGEWWYLRQWAVAYNRGETDAASVALSTARACGKALSRQSGESLLRDSVAAIDAADDEVKPALAEAHRLYYDARIAYSDRKPSMALPLFQKAAAIFRRGSSPMEYMADYYVVSALHDLGRNEEAAAALGRVRQSSSPTYKSLHAQILWLEGTMASAQGAIHEAITSYGRALDTFSKTGEEVYANAMRSRMTILYAQIGKNAEAWRMWVALFESMSRAGDDWGLQHGLEYAARWEVAAQHWASGEALFAALLETDLQNPRLRADAMIWRALALEKLGDSDESLRRIGEAREASHSIDDQALRDAALNDFQFAEAVLIRQKQPSKAAELLADYIARAQVLQRVVFLPEAYLERGRAWRQLGRQDLAIADFRATLSLLDQSRGSLEAQELRDSFFVTSDTAWRELVDLLASRGEAEEAFLVAERARGLRATDAPETVDSKHDAERLVAHLDPDTVAAHYVVLRDRLLIFVARGGSLSVAPVAVGAEELQQLRRQFDTAINQDDAAARKKAASALYEVLVTPIAAHVSGGHTFVVVGDSSIGRIPFAALYDPVRRERLIDRILIVYAQSTHAYLQATAHSGLPSRQVLAVGNPAFDPLHHPELEPLRESEYEARGVASLYPEATLLLRGDASKRRVMAALPLADLIHIGTHAMANPREPERSYLVLAPEGDQTGNLYSSEIARLPLHARLVVLAGCRTGSSSAQGGADVRSIAFSFLAAGASNAIGTLWPVGDAASRAFSSELHRALSRGVTPAEALREAQLALADGPDLRLREPGVWAAFQLFGTGH